MRFPSSLIVTAISASILPAALASEPPDALRAPDGTIAKSGEEYRAKVRPATLENFRHEIYGVRPVGKPADLAFKVVREDLQALDGKAVMREIEITWSGPHGKQSMHPLLFTPAVAQKPSSAFVLIQFRKPIAPGAKNADGTTQPGNFDELAAHSWPVRDIIARGYATVAFDFNEVDPDRADGFKPGVRGLFGDEPQAPDAWGALSAWGWGASRVMDYLETDKAIDAKHVAIIGHSRAGKAATWCGAEDERFAMVISNNSGCSGAALARGKQGERVANITTKFPYWFCANYRKYADHEDDLPIDQHQLLGLIAPRPLYVASATEDLWSDPTAEFKSAVLAGSVYKLFGLTGLESETMPQPDHAMLGGSIGYHIRTGKHDLVASDWAHYMDFADLKWSATAR